MKRREEVTKLRLRGYSIYDIRDELKTSLITVRRDLEYVEKDIRNQIKSDIFDRIMIEIIGSLKEANRELWKIFSSTDNEALKVKILSTIIDSAHKKSEILENLGIRRIQEENHPNEIEAVIALLREKIKIEDVYPELRDKEDKETLDLKNT